MNAGYGGAATRWSSVPRTLRSASLAAIAVLSAAMAQAQSAPAVGGPGGVPFADRAPGGARLGAVALRTGEMIDAIAAVVVLPDGRRVPLQVHGGPGGSARVFALQDGEYLVAMRVWSGQVVEAIQFETNLRTSAVYGNPRSPPRRLVVPPGAEALGFIGRAGVYVDALGFALQRRAPQSPSPQHQSAGVNAPPPGPPPPTAPPPAAPVSRTELDGPANSFENKTDSFKLKVRFKQPASLGINLSTGPPRSGKCFGPQERILKRYSSPTAAQTHVVMFSGLKLNTLYHYSIRLDGGRCELGTATTAICLDTC